MGENIYMKTQRKIGRVISPEAVSDGAGVKLNRLIATPALDYLDPFLLLDHFGSEKTDDYMAGFPQHPHRGIETVTYMLKGVVHHKDTMGNAGTIKEGDIQWMTAGGGLMHEEMPEASPEGLSGFQLWVNLPSQLKMSKPRYQEVKANQIPVFERDGVKIKVIAGEVGEVKGAVSEIYAEPNYLDITIEPNGTFTHSIKVGHNAFAYVFEGSAEFDESGKVIETNKLVIFNDGDFVTIKAGDTGARFLLVSGKPLNEPVARYGPFVMNTREEIYQAITDLQNGTFIWTEEKETVGV
jgi:redox-sensitive bicupin YhaK (pirin superfamily)